MRENMIDKSIGKNVRKYREKANISQETLAEAVELSITSISNIERGINYPTMDNFIKIANYIGASADELLSGAIDKSYLLELGELTKSISQAPLEKQRLITKLIEVILNN